MRNRAVGAIFDPAVGVTKVTAAVSCRVQRAITKQTVEIRVVFYLVTRKVFAIRVAEKRGRMRMRHVAPSDR